MDPVKQEQQSQELAVQTSPESDQVEVDARFRETPDSREEVQRMVAPPPTQILEESGASLTRESSTTRAGPSSDDLLTALRDGPRAFNAFRTEQGPDWVPEIEGLDLRGVNLGFDGKERANLTGAIIKGNTGDSSTSFYMADLNDSRIVDNEMPGSVFSRAAIQRAIISGNVMPGADFSEVDIQRATISGNEMPDANFKKAQADDATIVDNQLEGACLEEMRCWRGSILRNSFKNASIGGMNCCFTAMVGNDFSDSDTHVQFDKPWLVEKYPNGANKSIYFRQCGFADNNFTRANLLGDFSPNTSETSTLLGSYIGPDNNFTGTNLTGVYMNSAYIRDVVFTEASTDGMFVGGANWPEAMLTEEQIRSLKGLRPPLGEAAENNLRELQSLPSLAPVFTRE